MLSLKAATELKLDHDAQTLMKEFPHLPGEDVVAEIEQVKRALMAGARFEDYIPVLAHRFARDHLLDKSARGIRIAA